MKMRISKLWRVLAMMFPLALLGCNSGSSSFSDTGTGGVVIGLTDAPGDFVTYQVDVTSLTLTKANNAVVETVPVKTRVDFAQYADLTEFLTSATVPSGTYISATMTLDYSNADIEVDDGSGGIVKVSSIQDEQGNPITTLDVSVVMSDGKTVVVAPGVPANMTVDFNLAASNAVDLSGTPTLTVQPFVVADIDPAAPKSHRLRGMLDTVDLQTSSFQVIMRPFFHQLTGSDRQFGTLTVATDSNTLYIIDGASYQGTNGLDALANQNQFSAVVAIGDVDPSTHTFTATEVHAGTSVPGGTLDAATGTVISRAGDVLTVKGATLVRSSGTVTFNDTETVQLGASTKVFRQLDASAHTIADISVGQRVTVFGTVDAADTTQLNATNGLVRMKLTTLRGIVANSPSPFTVYLQTIDWRRVAVFNFSGTGIDSAHDADPTNYEIGTGSLDITNDTPSTPVKILGFVTPFGQIGQTSTVDFNAQTIVNLSEVGALLAVNWNPAYANALGTPSTSGLTLDLTDAAKFHYVVRAGIATDLTTLGTNTTIQPPTSRTGLFVIQSNGKSQGYLTFGNFVTALAADLGGGASVKGIAARGTFDDAATTLTAGLIYVRLK